MSIDNKKTKFKISFFLTIFLLIVLLQTLQLNTLPVYVSNRSLTVKSILTFLNSVTIDGIPFLLGIVLSKRKINYSLGVKIWILAVITLIVFYLVFVITYPNLFDYWNIFGLIFPITTSTSSILSGLIIAILFQPYLFVFFKNKSTSQSIKILSSITVAFFIFTAGTNPGLTYSIWGLYLLLPFSWGLIVSRFRVTTKKSLQLSFTALIALGLSILLTIFFNKFPSISHSAFYSSINQNWNYDLLLGSSSPVILFLLLACGLVLRSSLIKINFNVFLILIPAVVFAQAPFAVTFWQKFLNYSHNYFPAKWKIFSLLLILLVVTIALWATLLFGLFKLKRINSWIQTARVFNFPQLFNLIKGFFVKYKKTIKLNMLTVLYFYCLNLISFYILSDNGFYLGNKSIFVHIFFNNFGVQLLSLIFILACFSILYFITTRYWVALGTTSILLLVMSVADKIKLNLRNEPIFPSEISEVVNLKTLIPMAGIRNIVFIVSGFVITLLIVVFLEVKHTVKLNSVKQRLIFAIFSLLVLISPIWINNKKSPIYSISQGFGNYPPFITPKTSAQIEGPTLTFVNYLNVEVMEKPSDYNHNAISDIIRKYKLDANQINKKRENYAKDQTIVFNLSESFVDPTTFPTLTFKKDPMPYIRSLSKKTTSGYMLSAGYGGGTANMEYETITGFNMGNFAPAITPYVQVTNRFSKYPNIGYNFDYKSAIHPFVGTFYSRVANYKRFGFNKFVYDGSKYKIYGKQTLGNSTYQSDETAYINGLKQIKNYKNGQFINLISIQNHMPYPADLYPNNDYYNKIGGKLANNKNIKKQMATYTKGVEYTDHAVHKFINEIEKIKKPITIVFYGDHYPAIIDQSAVSKYPIQMHSTTYFIYSNKYARQHGAKAKIAPTNYVSPASFIPMVLDQTNSKVTPYEALLTEVYRKLPAITINYNGSDGLELIDQKGKKVKLSSLSKKQKEILHDYQLIQYDMSKGNGFSMQTGSFYK